MVFTIFGDARAVNIVIESLSPSPLSLGLIPYAFGEVYQLRDANVINKKKWRKKRVFLCVIPRILENIVVQHACAKWKQYFKLTMCTLHVYVYA